MKLLLLSIVALATLRGEAVRWRGHYDAAHREALSRQLPLLVLLIRDNCEECHSLIRRLVDDGMLSHWINNHTVPVIVHFGARSSYPIELYYSTCFPTIFYVESSREIVRERPCCGDACFESLKRWKEKRP